MIKRKLAVYLTVVLCSVSGWSETFIIKTLIPKDITSLDRYERQNILALEEGVMDLLFDNGHIFFNTYGKTIPSNEVSSDRSNLSASSLIEETEADFYIEIEPDESGVKWKLYGTADLFDVDKTALEIHEKLSQTSAALTDNIKKHWYSLGQNVGENILKKIFAGESKK